MKGMYWKEVWLFIELTRKQEDQTTKIGRNQKRLGSKSRRQVVLTSAVTVLPDFWKFLICPCVFMSLA